MHKIRAQHTYSFCNTASAALTNGEHVVPTVTYSSIPGQRPDRTMDICSPKDEPEGSQQHYQQEQNQNIPKSQQQKGNEQRIVTTWNVIQQ